MVREHLARMSPGQHEGVAARAARSGETVWVANVSVDPRIDSDLRTLLTGVRGICAVPVVAAGEVVAVLEFLAREQLVPDASLTRALQEISAGLSEACARLRETQPVEPGSSQ